MNFIDGEVLCIDKPYGWTSFDAVKRVRGELSRRLGLRKIKVGHAGTLDPLATGVMAICTGRATRRIEELQDGIKEYTATLALGSTTPSFDLETAIDEHYPTGHITEQLVLDVLSQFTGTIRQIPPTYSACKINGKRAYDLARKGREVELKPKTLVIEQIDLLSFSQESISIHVVCGKGTYIRALARDIGTALSSGAHLTALRRTRVGDIRIEDCLSIPEVTQLIKTVPIEFPDGYQQP